jgi:microcystin degradation protein MlrC
VNSIRIAVASFSHETCTFCPKPTTVEDFEAGGVLYGKEILKSARGIPNYINGYMLAALEHDDVELVGILSAARSRGGSSGSWLTEECFDRYSYGIADGLREGLPFDGVLLALHGAMAVDGHLKPEAEIVRRCREVVGPDVPVMVTLDLHANEDHELSDEADGVFILKTYPHVDSEEIGYKAGICLIETIRGEFNPTMSIRKPGVITPSVFQGTGEFPAKEIMNRARMWEAREEDCYSVGVAFGFAYADVPDVGATVITVTNDNQKLADEITEDLSDYIWELREPFAGKKLFKTEKGVKEAIKLAIEGKTPVIIADHSDRVGDSTWVLRELIGQGARNFCIATIADDKTIQEIKSKAMKGEKVTVKVGGHSGCYAGEPVMIEGELTYLDKCQYILKGPMSKGDTRNLGLTAVLSFGNNNHVILTPTLHQVLDDAILPAVGLSLNNLEIVSIKSRVHFRAYFNEKAGSIVVVDALGLGPADLSQLDYHNIPENIYPVGKK